MLLTQAPVRGAVIGEIATAPDAGVPTRTDIAILGSATGRPFTLVVMAAVAASGRLEPSYGSRSQTPRTSNAASISRRPLDGDQLRSVEAVPFASLHSSPSSSTTVSPRKR